MGVIEMGKPTDFSKNKDELKNMDAQGQSMLAQNVWKATLEDPNVEAWDEETLAKYSPQEIERSKKAQSAIKTVIKAINEAGIQTTSTDNKQQDNKLPIFELLSRGGRVPLVFKDEAAANTFLEASGIAQIATPRASSHAYSLAKPEIKAQQERIPRVEEKKTKGLKDVVLLPFRLLAHKINKIFYSDKIASTMKGSYSVPFAAGGIGNTGFDGKPIKANGNNGEMLVIVNRQPDNRVVIAFGFESSSPLKRDSISGKLHLLPKESDFSPVGVYKTGKWIKKGKEVDNNHWKSWGEGYGNPIKKHGGIQPLESLDKGSVDKITDKNKSFNPDVIDRPPGGEAKPNNQETNAIAPLSPRDAKPENQTSSAIKPTSPAEVKPPTNTLAARSSDPTKPPSEGLLSMASKVVSPSVSATVNNTTEPTVSPSTRFGV